MLTNEQIRDLLRKETLKISQRKWAKDNGVHQADVNRIVNGKQAMTEVVAKALGYEHMWVKIEGPNKHIEAGKAAAKRLEAFKWKN